MSPSDAAVRRRPARRGGRRAAAWCLALHLAAVALVPAGPARAQFEYAPDFMRVAGIEFEGRRHVKEGDLLAAIKTRRPSRWPWADRPVLREDFVRSDTLSIAAAYRRHGYLDTRVGYRIEPESETASRVVFEIREGPRSYVESVAITGSHAYPEAALAKKLSSRPGRPYDPALIVADTTRISREYQDRGYIPEVGARVTRESTAVHVTYDVEPGPLYRFGEVYISVSGEPTLDPRLIRRELAIVPGEVYRYSKVERSQEQLVETGFFRLVQLDRLVDSSYAQVEWDLRLTERKPRWVDAGIGSGTAERFRFTGEWGNRNLFGSGLRGALASRLAFDGEGRFLIARGETSLLEPWLFGTRTRGDVTPYYERTTDRSFDFYRIDQHRRGVTLRASRDFGRTLRFQLVQDNAFVLQSVRSSAASLSDSQAAVVDSVVQATEPSYSTHRVRGIVERDRRDFPLNPGRGSYQNLLGEVVGGPLQGSSSFLKVDFTTSWYTPLPNGWVLATRLRAGAIDPFGASRRFTPNVTGDADVLRVPIEDRFRLGGVNTVRGYGEGDIPFSEKDPIANIKSGGLALLLGNVELRVPVYGPFGLEFFVDAGNVWDRPTYIRAGDLIPEISTERMTPSDLRMVFGFGGRLNLPFGPLRFDLTWGARPEEDGRWIQAQRQFTIGPAF